MDIDQLAKYPNELLCNDCLQEKKYIIRHLEEEQASGVKGDLNFNLCSICKQKVAESIVVNENTLAATQEPQISRKMIKKVERTVFVFKENEEIEPREPIDTRNMSDEDF